MLDPTRREQIEARKMKRAMTLLKAHEGLSDPEIMTATEGIRLAVERIRKRFVEGTLEKALNAHPRPG